jgi:hypothetical protein
LAKERCIPKIDNSEKNIYSWKTVFLKGTKDLLKLRLRRKMLFWGILTILGTKVKVPSV